MLAVLLKCAHQRFCITCAHRCMTEKDHIGTRCSQCHFVRYCSALCQRRHCRVEHRFECAHVASSGFSYAGLKASLQVKYGPVPAYKYELLRHMGSQTSIATKQSYHRYFDAARPHKLLPPRPSSAVIVDRQSMRAVHF